jgi:hypothetical protein
VQQPRLINADIVSGRLVHVFVGRRFLLPGLPRAIELGSVSGHSLRYVRFPCTEVPSPSPFSQ